MIKIKNCALFGGTFDPIHNGHLHLIKSLLASNRFDNFVVIPAGDPYQKTTATTARHRSAMVELALKDDAVTVSECEVNRTGPSYAIDTVEEIANQFPAERYTWIIGSDAFAGLPTWHRFEELKGLVNFLVVIRPGATSLPEIPGVVYEVMEISALDISATDIRNQLENGEDVSAVVPASVLAYIKENDLYGAS